LKSEDRTTILFIINPNAGDRKANRLIKRLERYRSVADYQLTQYAGHATQIVKEEFDKYNCFVAVGGDGTVNEIAVSLAGTDKVLAVYPGGSGNGVAREFGFGKNLKKLIGSVQDGKILKTDVIRINEKASIHFSGFGYDSAVADDFSRRKGRGFWNYVASCLKMIIRYQPIDATIRLKDETIQGKFFMINIANTRQFGYHAMISLNSNPTDGKFELVLVSSFPKCLFPIFSLKLFAGLLRPSKVLRIIPCSEEAIIETSNKLFHVDGEPLQMKSPITIKIEKGTVNVVDTGRVRF
jgi:diacylglycerol kinase family enzyme